uniref:Galectin n=1 Tax=Meloidogyne floridensis TaxID=298350 RepID=A0A915NNX4_9BILA
FTTPITAEVPFKNNLNTNQERHCEKRFTNKKYKLGKVFEKAVFFYIMTDKRGIKEKMELNLLNINASIIVEISSTNVNWRTINIEGNWTNPSKESIKLIPPGVNVAITILIQKYYLWIKLKHQSYYTAHNIFWPNKWWETENQFDKNIEADLLINGDFIPISVISVGHFYEINEKPKLAAFVPIFSMTIKNINLMQRFEELNTPYGTEIKNNDIQNGTKIIFRGVTNFKNKSRDDQNFQLILIHD